VHARALEEVRRIVVEGLRAQQAAVYLFGSYARRDASPHSDIDVAVESSAPLSAGTLARIRERLEESWVPYRVELVDLTRVGDAFRKRVLVEGVRWSD
jgi:predicted nucleotidyltransferase